MIDQHIAPSIPDDTPAIVRVAGQGERCGQVTVVAAVFIDAAACDAEYRRRLLRAYRGVWGDLGQALVTARAKRGVAA